jgi:hypothetical protein
MQNFERLGDQTRNHTWKIYTQNADGSRLTPISEGESIEAFGPDLFYMKSEGYILFKVQESATTYRWDMIQIGGPTATFYSWEDPSDSYTTCQVVPSPDGTFIGVMERYYASPSMDKTVTARVYEVSGTVQRVRSTWTVNGSTESTWIPGGDFHIRDDNMDAWRMDIFNGNMTTTAPDCVYPKTTSSDISASGIKIGPGESLDNPVLILETGATPFGCQ